MESWTDLTVIGTKSIQLLLRPRVLIFDPSRSGPARACNVTEKTTTIIMRGVKHTRQRPREYIQYRVRNLGLTCITDT